MIRHAMRILDFTATGAVIMKPMPARWSQKRRGSNFEPCSVNRDAETLEDAKKAR